MRIAFVSALIVLLTFSLVLIVGCPQSESEELPPADPTPPPPPDAGDGAPGALSIDIPEGERSPEDAQMEPGATAEASPEGQPTRRRGGTDAAAPDRGGDGGRPRGEWGAGGPGGPGGEGGRERQRRDPAEMFAEFDKNGDGRLTPDELPERMAERIMRADADGDGAVTLEELEQARRNRQNRGDGPLPAGGQ